MLQCCSEINCDTLVSTIGDVKKCSNKFACFVLFILGLSDLIQHKVCWRLGYCYSWYLSSYTRGWCRVCIVSNWWLMGLHKEVRYLCSLSSFYYYFIFGDIMKWLKPLLSSSNIGTNMPRIFATFSSDAVNFVRNQLREHGDVQVISFLLPIYYFPRNCL